MSWTSILQEAKRRKKGKKTINKEWEERLDIMDKKKKNKK